MSASEVHVVPVDDLTAHETSDGCLCGPATEPVTRDDGTIGWCVVHHALDGRL